MNLITTTSRVLCVRRRGRLTRRFFACAPTMRERGGDDVDFHDKATTRRENSDRQKGGGRIPSTLFISTPADRSFCSNKEEKKKKKRRLFTMMMKLLDTTKVWILSSLLIVPFSNAFVVAPVRTTTTHNNFVNSNPTKTTSITSSLSMVEGLQEAWTSYNTALESDPLLVKSITASVILGAADLAGQTIEEALKDEEDKTENKGIDIARTVRFAFFGLVLQAPWNHFYYQYLDGVLPPTEEPFTATTGIKVVIDQFVQAPVFTVLIFTFLGLLEGKSIAGVKQQLDDDYKDTMLANWKLWVPATVVNIAFVPPLLRVLYLNCVFFFWSIFLSIKLNKESDSDVEV